MSFVLQIAKVLINNLRLAIFLNQTSSLKKYPVISFERIKFEICSNIKRITIVNNKYEANLSQLLGSVE
jgi:hypothetical protein